MGTSSGFLGQNFVPSSGMGSVRKCRLGIRTNEAKPNDTAVDYNPRFWRDISFLSSYTKSTQVGAPVGHLSDLSVFLVPSYGSVVGFLGESPVQSPPSRNPETEP